MRSPWFGVDDQRVELGFNHPTHFAYIDGSAVNGMRKQWLVVGFGPTAIFRDGRAVMLQPVPAGCSIKGMDSLAVRAPARMIYKYRAV